MDKTSYEIFCELCEKKGKSPSRVAIEMGISQLVISMWKKRGRAPSAKTLEIISDYFKVPVFRTSNKEDDLSLLILKKKF